MSTAAPTPDAPTAHAPLAEADIARLVERFYQRVRLDPLLGPVFAPVVEDWDVHIATLIDFWSAVVLRSGRYRGNPMAMHRRLPIQPEHFERWLALWNETAREELGEDNARIVGDHAARIGRSLRHGLGLGPTRPSPPQADASGSMPG
ncbi:group III truncated hemoglobin [Marilutibacter maris]|uniref:Preprotein translocase subunit TatC n=1 Tax=Marilutibacter maris TaxID=1605891 RepID=A0A2U9T4S0_9GAMM|nr:group III truncated hemoglobin [Lysobacter maris]AWV06385.1 preprotein translocase subunit TatC [Lysobacter maris]